MPKFPYEDWLPENLRLTAFPSPDSNLKPQAWWEAVAGSEPDQVSTAKRGTSSVEGQYGCGKLILRSVLDRIDWLFAPSESTIENLVLLANPNSIGPIVEVMEAFTRAIEKWLQLPDSPEVNRMAFGAVLGHPTDDHKQAYLDLMEYIPVSVDPSSSDLLFQINPPPIGSKYVQGLKFNRLSKWMAAQLMVIASPTIVSSGVPLLQTIAPQLSIRLELDINTLPSFQGPIPRESLSAVFTELVDEARNIVLNGVNQNNA